MKFNFETKDINYIKISYIDAEDNLYSIKAILKEVNKTSILVCIKSNEQLNLLKQQDVKVNIVCKDGLYQTDSKIISIEEDVPYNFIRLEKPEDVDYVNTHGTSTGLGDKAESHAVARVFGDKVQNPNLSVSSTKSMIGHMLGASGAVESIICIKAMQNSLVPPTINLENQDEAVANLDYTPNKAKAKEINVALSNSFGFGGHNASLVFKKI